MRAMMWVLAMMVVAIIAIVGSAVVLTAHNILHQQMAVLCAMWATVFVVAMAHAVDRIYVSRNDDEGI